MNFDDLHEVEEVILQAGSYRACKTLWPLLLELGYTLRDDIFSINRAKKPPTPIWQTKTLVSVYIHFDDSEVYSLEDRWNSISLKYLLATQPRTGISMFTKHAADLAGRLSIPLVYKGNEVTQDRLNALFEAIADEVTEQIAEPGSEDLAIVIESTYPRYR